MQLENYLQKHPRDDADMDKIWNNSSPAADKTSRDGRRRASLFHARLDESESVAGQFPINIVNGDKKSSIPSVNGSVFASHATKVKTAPVVIKNTHYSLTVQFKNCTRREAYRLFLYISHGAIKLQLDTAMQKYGGKPLFRYINI